MDGHTGHDTIDFTAVSAEQMEEVESTERISITFIKVFVHLIESRIGIVPQNVITLAEEKVAIHDGMVAVVPLADSVVTGSPSTERHFLIVVAVVICDSIIGGHIGRNAIRSRSETVSIDGNNQECVVNQTTGENRVVVNLIDVLVVLHCRLKEVVTSSERQCGSTEKDDIFKFHICIPYLI